MTITHTPAVLTEGLPKRMHSGAGVNGGGGGGEGGQSGEGESSAGVGGAGVDDASRADTLPLLSPAGAAPQQQGDEAAECGDARPLLVLAAGAGASEAGGRNDGASGVLRTVVMLVLPCWIPLWDSHCRG